MNELLQKHGCANVFSVPEGLKELMSDITREVLREQPQKIFDFIANYLSVLILTREHGILAVRILDDLCDCKPSISEHLMEIGMEKDLAEMLAKLIKEQIEKVEPVEGKEKVNEMYILKKIMARVVLDETTAARVCQVVRNAYRDYWYRKKLMEKSLKVDTEEPWEIAAERTIDLYKKTKPSFTELTRAVQKIQAAYRGYYVRKNLLRHLRPAAAKNKGPKVELLGPPIDVAESREIDLGPMIDIKVTEDDVAGRFDKKAVKDLGVGYDPNRAITHVDDEEPFLGPESTKGRMSALPSAKSLVKSRPDKSRQSYGDLSVESGIATSQPKSREPSIPGSSHQSEDISQKDTAHTFQKISFAQASPIVVRIDDEAEIIEDVEAAADDGATEAEVPEDISENVTEVASVPSTAPDTANTTDAEEEEGDVTGDK